MRVLIAAMLCCVAAWGADYKGPRPPKPDVPYLMHADNLVELESTTAQEERQKNGSSFGIPGASSPARTPLAEPIFIMESKSISPERLGLYRMEVKNGRREVVVSNRRKGGSGKPYHLSVTRIGNNLYRIEASETLENGEYSLSPEGSNQAFCFEVY